MSVVALIPAHNEEEGIERAVAGLWAQTSPPDEIIVVADNCTDATAERAERAGASVILTEGNTSKKAGALNQALRQVLPRARSRSSPPGARSCGSCLARRRTKPKQLGLHCS